MRGTAGLIAGLLVLGSALPPVSAETLGRLFMTPEQRANLDDLRYQSKFAPAPEPEPAPVVQTTEPANPEPVVSSLRINGLVKPSRGAGTVWLNQQQVERGGSTREGIQVSVGRRSRDGVRIQLPSGVDTIVLKPGQKIDVATGSVLEAYEADPDANAKSAFANAPGDGATAATKEPQATATGAKAPDPATLTREQLLRLLQKSGADTQRSGAQAVTP